MHSGVYGRRRPHLRRRPRSSGVASNRNRLRATDVHRLRASAQSGCWPVTRCQGYFAIAGAGAPRGNERTKPLDEAHRAVRLRYMASVRISTVEAPLDRPALVDPAIRLLRRALALGLLGDNERVDRLDLELVRRIAQEASAAGIGQDAAVALLQGVSGPNRLAALIERLDDSLTESPLPDRELPELLRVFGREDLAVLTGTSGVSLGRYVAGSRKWPDELATRIHWLALVLSDLAGAYNDFGARRWFERERTQLDGRSPRQVLGTEWDPASPDIERVRQLAASLAGVGAAT
jgi:uncharacterized protein (DUF2384 family)